VPIKILHFAPIWQ